MSTRVARDGLSDSEAVNNVLLLAPATGESEAEACADLVTADRPSDEDVLRVTFTESADERIDAWRTHVGRDLPAKMSVVTVGGASRSTAARAGESRPANVSVHAVSDPADLTTLGIRITEQFSEWRGDGNRIVLDFDSLTSLLQHADQQRVFQFLHVLKGRVTSMDGLAHYHMDPTAHDRQEVNTFKPLVDAVVDTREDDP